MTSQLPIPLEALDELLDMGTELQVTYGICAMYQGVGKPTATWQVLTNVLDWL